MISVRGSVIRRQDKQRQIDRPDFQTTERVLQVESMQALAYLESRGRATLLEMKFVPPYCEEICLPNVMAERCLSQV